MSKRSEIWDAALKTLIKQGKFKMEDLDVKESERHTARRVLRDMEDMGWLMRTNNQAAIWRIGPEGEKMLNISDYKIEQSRP